MNEQPEPKPDTERPWHAEFPNPNSTAGSISREELLQLLRDDSKVPGRDFLSIDVRRTDFEVVHPSDQAVHADLMV